MDKPGTHKIKHQYMDLDLQHTHRADLIQGEMTDYLTSHLLPQIESLFDAIAGDDRYIGIEKIVLDLGDITDSNWQRSLTDKILEKLQYTISNTGRAEHSQDRQPPDQEARDPLENTLQQFLFFLTHGRLPGWGSRPGKDLFQSHFSELQGHHWRRISRLVSSNHHARLRLVTHCCDDLLGHMLATISGMTGLRSILKQTAPSITNNKIQHLWRNYFWYTLLKFIGEDEQTIKQGPAMVQNLGVARTACLRLSKVVDLNEQRQKRASERGMVDYFDNLPEPWQTWFRAVMPHSRIVDVLENDTVSLFKKLLAGHSLHALVKLDTNQLKTHLPELDRNSDGIIHSKETHPVTDSLQEQTSNDEEAIVPSSGAGMVILHPFLLELFQSQELVNERHFKNRDCQHQALRMLAYLTFGQEQVPEYDLLLAKLICNIPWQEAIADDELSESQRQACDELLQAVLKHWQALKSSSPDWLREQFFMREGNFSTVDNGWKLTVERQAQDILLDKLPWGLGVIRLPWMTETLFVDWSR